MRTGVGRGDRAPRLSLPSEAVYVRAPYGFSFSIYSKVSVTAVAALVRFYGCEARAKLYAASVSSEGRDRTHCLCTNYRGSTQSHRMNYNSWSGLYCNLSVVQYNAAAKYYSARHRELSAPMIQQKHRVDSGAEKPLPGPR